MAGDRGPADRAASGPQNRYVDEELRRAIESGRQRVAHGERPMYHFTWTSSRGGEAVDVTIRELPLVHLFAPDDHRVADVARLIIARTLGVDQHAFDVVADADTRK